MKLTLCMIVKNEEEVLGRCLNSVKDCVDEIVIADTGSTDDTKEIALGFGAEVYDFPWRDDFAAARNFAFSKASGDYLLWLDADDEISPENAKKLLALKESLGKEQPDMVMCPYVTAFEDDTPIASFYRERILKRNAGFIWEGRVHECIAPHGKVIHSEFTVFHRGSSKKRGARNLRIYRKWAAKEALSERDKFYYGRELYYNMLYTEAVAMLEEMLDGDGWYVNKIEACKILSYCYAAQGEREQAKSALLRSFLFGEPRAFICCELAALFKKDSRLKEAVFWYECALSCRDHSAEGDFEEPGCRGLTPLVELTCCCYALGETVRALEYHKKAEELSPENSSVRYNRDFFRKMNLL